MPEGAQAAMQPLVILAGGQSRRMGCDKAELKIGEDRLIDRVFKRVSPQGDRVFISASHNYELGVACIEDRTDGPRGPVAGLYSAYRRFSEETDVTGFFTVAVDTPNLPDDLVSGLFDPDHSAIAADAIGTHPTQGWWRIRDLGRVFAECDLNDNLSLHDMAKKSFAKTVHWQQENLFHNINSPNDVTEYLTRKS